MHRIDCARDDNLRDERDAQPECLGEDRRTQDSAHEIKRHSGDAGLPDRAHELSRHRPDQLADQQHECAQEHTKCQPEHDQ